MGVSRRVGLVVGDTPGHFYPALAVAQAYRQRNHETEITFFGPRGGRAAMLAAGHHCRYEPVSSSALARVGPVGRALAAVRTLSGIVEARRFLVRARIELVIGFGGFASGAVVLAARSAGCRTAIHEANVRPGLANRLLAGFADEVHVSRWTDRARLPSARTVVTGWPVRDAVTALAAETHGAPSDHALHLLVCSGSRGGEFLAHTIPPLVGRLVSAGRAVDVRHQSDDADAGALRRQYGRFGASADVVPISADMAGDYRWADFAITRAGAGTIAELALAGLPALLVPLADAAEDHQVFNAQAYAAGGAALWTREADWQSETLAAQISTLLAPDAWSAASCAARQWATPSAPDAVVDACEALIERHR